MHRINHTFALYFGVFIISLAGFSYMKYLNDGIAGNTDALPAAPANDAWLQPWAGSMSGTVDSGSQPAAGTDVPAADRAERHPRQTGNKLAPERTNTQPASSDTSAPAVVSGTSAPAVVDTTTARASASRFFSAPVQPAASSTPAQRSTTAVNTPPTVSSTTEVDAQQEQTTPAPTNTELPQTNEISQTNEIPQEEAWATANCPNTLADGSTAIDAEQMLQAYSCRYLEYCWTKNDGSGGSYCKWQFYQLVR